jgi:vancomycin resistance protein YoaR
MVRCAKLALWLVALALALLVAAGFGFAGSPSRIAEGVTVAGVDVGGLTAGDAEAKLAALAREHEAVPVAFTVGERRWSLRPDRLDLSVDWGAAVASALAEGDGPLPLRGLERLKVRLFGADLEPHADVYEARLRHEIARIAGDVNAPARDAAIALDGLAPRIVPAGEGSRLERSAARATIVSALASFDREAVPLPVVTDRPRVTAETLRPVLAQVRTALSAPVRLTFSGGAWKVAPVDLARLLVLPAHGSAKLAVGGPEAKRYFENLARGVRRPAVSADFAVAADGSVQVVRARPGRELDVAATGRGLLEAALRTQARSAPLVIAAEAPRLTTAEARKLGVERQLASYTTLYSGTADRIQNLQKAVALLDGAVIEPGATFSFNERVGPRTEERGFRPAPVIMDGEYELGVGGGVSQVATTVFNAAWDAGLKITRRTAHGLYISRYPLGRDATVNYPDIDLQFRNDTGRWLVLAADYDESGIIIRLLGSGAERSVVSEAGPLEETAPPEIERTPDPTLYVGERAVDDYGEPARAVQVTRTVYEGDEILYEESWSTSYRSEPRLVRVGTKPLPEPETPPPPPEEKKKKKDEPPPPPPGDSRS